MNCGQHSLPVDRKLTLESGDTAILAAESGMGFHGLRTNRTYALIEETERDSLDKNSANPNDSPREDPDYLAALRHLPV
jgi:hypothetical protein